MVESGISISRVVFEISRLKVQNVEKMWFFSAFWGVLRPFGLCFAIIPQEQFSMMNEPLHRIKQMFLHP